MARKTRSWYSKAMKKNKKTPGTPSSSAAQRYVDAMVDADIESLARSPEIEAVIAAWEADGVPVDDQLARLKVRFAETD
ncbi:MAG: hypothetical protein AAF501_00125 [Pseudomonadota bacterium]